MVKKTIIPFIFLALLTHTHANAGLYTEQLSNCLISSSSHEDRVSFLRWFFYAMADHLDSNRKYIIPSESSYTVDEKLRKVINRLLTQDCKTELILAVQNDSNNVGAAFEKFAQIAVLEFMEKPEVDRRLVNVIKHIDWNKLN